MAANASAFGAGRLFLSNSRTLLLLLNHARHRTLHRVFGTSAEQDDLLTVVLALAALDATYAGVRRVVPASLRPSGTNAALGLLGIRETGFAVGGPGSRAIPGFAGLLAVALAGGAAVPAARRALGGARATEHRVRSQRLARYRGAQRTFAPSPGSDDAPVKPM